MNSSRQNPPATGERRARLGYGAQDRVAATLVLDALRSDSFESVRLADLDGGRVDDFVLIWTGEVHGNSVKWSGTGQELSWPEFVGAGEPLIKQLADGWLALRQRWPGRRVRVYLRTNRSPSDASERNRLVPNISLSQFLSREWQQFSSEVTKSDDVSRAWQVVQRASGLNDSQFGDFVQNGCTIITEMSVRTSEIQGATLDDEQWQREFDRLRRAINDWVETSDFQVSDFSAAEIRNAIGLVHDYRKMLQRFPEPEIGYEENENSRGELKQKLDDIDSGYIALVGPAGAGKSTLTHHAFEAEPYTIQYFAYIPRGLGDPLERGDMLAFYRYIITVLDQWEPQVRKSHGISDLAQARESFQSHVSRIHERYLSTGNKTVILIDGLDHVVREAGVDRPLYSELPLPSSLLPGCVIVISTQPQAVQLLRPEIQTHLEESGRTISISPLPAEAAERCISRSPIADKLSTDDRSLIVRSFGGNPMILTYVLKALIASDGIPAIQVINEFADYRGEADQYYADRLRRLLVDSQSKHLLALLSRVRTPTQLSWLQEWPEWGQFEVLYKTQIAAFTDTSNHGTFQFVHNSLTSYLRRVTLPDVPGAEPEVAERRYYTELAERCPAGRPSLAMSRDRLYYEMMAGNYSAVLKLGTLEWFREGASSFVPPSEMNFVIRACLRSAVALNDTSALLRIAAATKEIDQRTVSLTSVQIADHFLELGKPRLALDHIVNGAELLVEAHEALRFAERLAQYGEARRDANLLQVAARLFDLAKPVHILYSKRQLEHHEAINAGNVLTAWASAAAYFVPIQQALDIIDELQFTRSEHRLANEIDQMSLRLEYFVSVLDRWLFDEIPPILARIDVASNRILSFRIRLRYAETLQYAGVADSIAISDLKESARHVNLKDTDRLRYADCLIKANQPKAAKRIIKSVKLPTPEAYPGHDKNPMGTADNRIRLSRIRATLGLDPITIPAVSDDELEAPTRVASACAQVGLLWATFGQEVPYATLTDKFKDLLAYHRKRISFDPSWRNVSWALAARREIYNAIANVANAGGPTYVKALRDAVLSAASEHEKTRPDDVSLRNLIVRLFVAKALTQTEARDLVGKATSDTNSQETSERTEACFSVAKVYLALGLVEQADKWVEKAGTAAHGIGYHKDYQMVYWVDWLDRSLGDGASEVSSDIVQIITQCLEVAGGDGGSYARRDLMRICSKRNSSVTSLLGLEMIDRDQFGLGSLLEGILHGACDTHADAKLLCSVYCHLYSRIDPKPDGNVGASIVALGGTRDERTRLAARCVRSIRTNSSPDSRLQAVKRISDELLDQGDTPDKAWLEGLQADRDGSTSSSTRCELDESKNRSLSEVADIIADPDRFDEWNPLPEKNAFFHWDEAIDKITPRDLKHLQLLEELVRTVHYSSVSTAALAVAASRMGDTITAGTLAERAVLLSKDAGWVDRHDGGYKKRVYSAIIPLDHDRWLLEARESFKRDLTAGRIGSYSLHSEIGGIFDILEWEWPKDEAREIIRFYIEGMIASIEKPPVYVSLDMHVEPQSPNSGVVLLILHLLANPVPAVGMAARSILIDCIQYGGFGLTEALDTISNEQTIIIEQVLAAIHVCAKNGSSVDHLRRFVGSAKQSNSIAVVSIAHRIFETLQWHEDDKLPSVPLQPIFSLALPPERHQRQELGQHLPAEIPGHEIGVALELYDSFIRLIAKRTEIPYENLIAQARRHYQFVVQNYTWSRNNADRVQKWHDALPVLSYVPPQALVARDAVMRLLNDLYLSDQIPMDTVDAYDDLFPVYDAGLETIEPSERPQEVRGIKCDRWSKVEQWVNQFDKKELLEQAPLTVGDRVVLAERSTFSRPEWEWPKEKRFFCPLPETVRLDQLGSPSKVFPSVVGYTLNHYLRLVDDLTVPVISNDQREITSPAADWLALNPAVGLRLNWLIERDGLFRWVDESGKVMVESIWWRDGWIKLKPPHSFEVLGEGWLVLCANEAYEAVMSIVGPARIVVGGHRSCSVEKQIPSDRISKDLIVEFRDKFTG